MVLVAVVIGLLGGLCAVGFRLLIKHGNEIAWGEGHYTLDYIRQLPTWWKIAVPSAGGLLVGLIVHYFAREAKGHGVPEVMEAVAVRGGRIRPRVVIAKLFGSGICIASGGSVGREGPIVQVGCAIGSTLGQWLNVGERRLRTLVGCGAAAGIAGTFNAPIGGALFAVEIILGDFGVAHFSPIVISSVAATVVSHQFLGNFPNYDVQVYSLVSSFELFAYAGLGIVAGLVALAYVKVLYAFEDFFDASSIYPPLKTVIGGAIIGVIALWLPEVYGVGHEAINEALAGSMMWKLMAILIGVKILSVSITIGSGGSGGIFAPSLFIGAMTGGVFGNALHSIWPNTTAGPGAYALVGMGAVVAAGTHAPITAILIMFELTTDYKIILPLMISCIIATLLATRLNKSSIYTLKLLRRGIDTAKRDPASIMRRLLVREEMRTDVVTVQSDEQLIPILSKFIDHPHTSVFVVDSERNLQGVITDQQIRPILADSSSFEFLLIAEDMMLTQGFPTVSPDDNLAHVMKQQSRFRGEIPVIEEGKLIGAIWPEDVIERYNIAVFSTDAARSLAASVESGPTIEPIPGTKGTGITEIPVSDRFVGKSVSTLDIRRRFDATILLIKQKSPETGDTISTVPDADYVFRSGDVMVVMGPSDKLKHLEFGS